MRRSLCSLFMRHMSNIRNPEDVDAWVRTMDEVGVDRSVVFTGATGAAFDRQVEVFLERHPGRFQAWWRLLESCEVVPYSTIVGPIGVGDFRLGRGPVQVGL